MLSRIAENLYWMGRYIERAENTSRILDVNYLAIIEAPQVAGARGIVTEKWAPLLDIMESKEEFKEHYKRADGQNVPYWLAIHPDNAASIRSSLRFARENARALRDRISTEMWEAINSSYLALCVNAPENIEEDALHDYCVAAREASHLFFGIAHATLPHDLGWYFMRAGQFLERADNTLRTLIMNLWRSGGRTPVSAGVEIHRDIALLKSLSAYEAYRKTYDTGLNSRRIYEFLLLSNRFPRSVRYCLELLQESLEKIHEENQNASAQALQASRSLTQHMAAIKDEAQISVEESPSMQELINQIADLSTTISSAYFSPEPVTATQTQSQSQS
ncbi:MAG: alpha-E domain-containing protein [Trueperaceae bacterium]|nr:alpha-E domain-containing protein [Trueperaceae bacterium]